MSIKYIIMQQSYHYNDQYYYHNDIEGRPCEIYDNIDFAKAVCQRRCWEYIKRSDVSEYIQDTQDFAREVRSRLGPNFRRHSATSEQSLIYMEIWDAYVAPPYYIATVKENNV